METTVAERWQAWVDEKTAAGLCSRCGKRPPTSGKDYCEVCARLARSRRVRLYNKRLRQGLCPHCGGKREDQGIIGCRSCNQKIALSRFLFRERRPLETFRGLKTLYQLRLMRGRRREGLCPTCGHRIDEEGFKLCSQCRKQGRERYYSNRESTLEKRRQQHRLSYKPKPLCRVCGHQRLRCLCGRMMKTHHGEESCLYTCTCGNVKTFAMAPVEAS